MIKKVFSFIVWGLATTALNVGFFLLFRHMGIPLTPAVILAWLLSVTFSYFANKKMVFHDKTSGLGAVLKSMLLFYSSRAFSGLMDVVLMNVFVKVLGWDELGEHIQLFFLFFSCVPEEKTEGGLRQWIGFH